MSPAPSREHQRVSAIIFAKIYNFLSGKECEVYFAPFDVRLAETKDEVDEEMETVVQPDIVVVCDQNKLVPNNMLEIKGNSKPLDKLCGQGVFRLNGLIL